MDGPPTFLFAGGGTGGHLFPGIAVAQELKQRHKAARLIFIGSTRAIEASIVAEYHLEHRMLPVESLAILKRNPFKFAVRNWRAWQSASRLITELRPSVVVGLGGYASAPLVWAARRSRVPVVLLEQNVIPGRTTRWLCRSADRVCVSFSETIARLPDPSRATITGNPVRDVISSGFPVESMSNGSGHLESEILILGGSQGADSLNDAVLSAVQMIRDEVKGWRFVHQSGPRQLDEVRKAYLSMGVSAIVEPFFNDMPNRYASATLVVSRAGATTLAELSCIGRPMLLVPFPHAADDHQRANAILFRDKFAAVLVEQTTSAEKTGLELAKQLRGLMNESARRVAMAAAAQSMAQPDASKNVADVIDELLI